ncbi:predicted protein [Arabidopsis lyrata subsp. lyrata]|uniref:Predicted protein n=1 Tax=Arabidopsis lyrata subsp. lyrata TaxID=81972 RepID=D7MIR0_ARALL|nr:predicted protein [Arabidopsis lyrata subsp. lyrata]
MRKGSESFMLFVDGVLALQAEENAPLNRFHVKCQDVDQNWVLEWIPKVLKRGVLDIDLHMPYSPRHFRPNSVFYPLPSEIFTSKKLVRLKIHFEDAVKIDVEGDVSLPKLKTLHLDYVKLDTRMFHKLLSGCHALEELLLFNLIWEESSKPEPCLVTVSVPTLKILKFSRFENFSKVTDFKPIVLLSFDFPKLVYLEYLDTIADMYQQVSFDSLVEAKLGLCKNPKQIKDDKNNVRKLFMGICNVKTLHLTADGLRGLHHRYRKRYERYFGDENGRCMLKRMDNMRVKKDIDVCLSSSPVKVIKILNFGEEDTEFEENVADKIMQVKQFLETMPELEQVMLYYNTPEVEDVMKVFKELQKLPRVASAKCEIQIISDNLNLSMIKGTNL